MKKYFFTILILFIFVGCDSNKYYGSEFKSFTPNQQRYINLNLEKIYDITYKYLHKNSYPQDALKKHQQDLQLIYFYIQPNGTISKIYFKKSLGYSSLEKNTIEVVKLASKYYPRPKTKTKITLYFNYSL